MEYVPGTFYTLARSVDSGFHVLQGDGDFGTMDMYRTVDEARAAWRVFAQDASFDSDSVRMLKIEQVAVDQP